MSRSAVRRSLFALLVIPVIVVVVVGPEVVGAAVVVGVVFSIILVTVGITKRPLTEHYRFGPIDAIRHDCTAHVATFPQFRTYERHLSRQETQEPLRSSARQILAGFDRMVVP